MESALDTDQGGKQIQPKRNGISLLNHTDSSLLDVVKVNSLMKYKAEFSVN